MLFIFGGKSLQVIYVTGLTLTRNLGIILAFMVLFCFIHIIAAEFVSAQRPKGDVLLFRRTRRTSDTREMDVEKAPSSVNIPVLRDPRKTYNTPLAIEKQTSILTWDGLSYDIKVNGKVRRLLDEVDGWVKPGTLTALMVGWKRVVLLIFLTYSISF